MERYMAIDFSDIRYQELPNAKREEADILIQRIAFGESISGLGGTEAAPDAILEVSEQMEYYDEDLDWSPMKHLKVSVEQNATREYDAITPAIKQLKPTDKQLLISLGGDHSITPQITAALLSKPTTIVFLDAHADLRKSYMGNEYSHATPAHHLLEQGHKLIMIGIRSLYEEEAIRVQTDKNIDYYSDRVLQKESIKSELLKKLSALDEDIYLSIDMDVFNPAYVPSVGTPQAGGIDYYFATDILQALFLDSNAHIKGVDMVELIPEESHVSQLFSAKLLQKIISYWGISQGFKTQEQNGSQMLISYE